MAKRKAFLSFIVTTLVMRIGHSLALFLYTWLFTHFSCDIVHREAQQTRSHNRRTDFWTDPILGARKEGWERRWKRNGNWRWLFNTDSMSLQHYLCLCFICIVFLPDQRSKMYLASESGCFVYCVFAHFVWNTLKNLLSFCFVFFSRVIFWIKGRGCGGLLE